MEIGRIPAIAPGTLATPTNGSTVQAVQTILPEYQTVTQTGRSESAQLTFREVSAEETDAIREQLRLEREARELRNREVRREIEVDRDTSAPIFRAIDVTTGDVVRQYPEEARLRLSAYIQNILE